MLAVLFACVSLLAAFSGASPARAQYGLNGFDVQFTNQDGTPATQAGSHPYAVTTSFEVNNTLIEFPVWKLSGATDNLNVEQIKGFVGDATAMPRCKGEDFARVVGGETFHNGLTACPENTIVGINAAAVLAPIAWFTVPVYNLEPPPGVQVRLGFDVEAVPVVIDVGVKNSGDYNVIASTPHIPQVVRFFGAVIQLWGNPADPSHDDIRGRCGSNLLFPATFDEVKFVHGSAGPASCPVESKEKPFLTLPGDCAEPLTTNYEANSWWEPEFWIKGSVTTHDNAEPPNPQRFTGCEKVPFEPEISAQPSSASAESPTGLDFNLDFNQDGLTSPGGIAQSTIKKTVVTLPEGVTINPSIGEGLGYCSKADYERESLDIAEGEGCPDESKIGSVKVETPLIENPVEGSLYLAQQGDPATPELENPFDSLIAFYIILRSEQEHLLVKIPAKVEPDPRTGQLITMVDNIPQLPFSHFNLHFREGKRSALTTPPACGSYETVAKLTPWANPDQTLTAVSTFEITGGIGQGPCPPGGIPPFHPDFEAGSINNNAASYSPFDMRLIRHDGEQDMTKFGSILPPGVVGNLSGVTKCSDADIAAARAKTGREELAHPSCPANSQIGTTKAGAGVGPALTYVPGKVYLGGPYHGDPLSVISVTPAVAGPFDAGDVVVHIALNLNPRTAEVEVDGASSDPIPHILKGIPLKVRDLRVYVDRQHFILNPTSCDPTTAKATLFGAYLNVFDPSDDVPVDLSTRYQAANCLNLGFEPHLGLHLKGGTRRGSYPGLKAVYSPKPGEANVKGLVVRLPRSAFLEQGHIRTICTRVQYAAQNCPKAARYGYIKAWTPLLEEPLQGPVWLRSSDHKLPDMVFDLRGLVNVEVATRIDSFKGGIRATVEDAPDAPISRVILRMQGGKKGLIVNSRNICLGRNHNRANVVGLGQNGKQFRSKPLMQVRCGRHRKHKRHHRKARGGAGGAQQRGALSPRSRF
ncbi:MAG TPA: hypothetical protein VFG58_04000 [Solirubrobacterales bacterium]|nr:hypothetical protein [Solirubrobacterales bacterium]